jgi:hypothetical protein
VRVSPREAHHGSANTADLEPTDNHKSNFAAIESGAPTPNSASSATTRFVGCRPGPGVRRASYAFMFPIATLVSYGLTSARRSHQFTAATRLARESEPVASSSSARTSAFSQAFLPRAHPLLELMGRAAVAPVERLSVVESNGALEIVRLQRGEEVANVARDDGGIELQTVPGPNDSLLGLQVVANSGDDNVPGMPGTRALGPEQLEECIATDAPIAFPSNDSEQKEALRGWPSGSAAPRSLSVAGQVESAERSELGHLRLTPAKAAAGWRIAQNIGESSSNLQRDSGTCKPNPFGQDGER